jgi:hypothetical protein
VQVQNKPHEGVMNVRLFLGLLAWLRIGRVMVKGRERKEEGEEESESELERECEE